MAMGVLWVCFGCALGVYGNDDRAVMIMGVLWVRSVCCRFILIIRGKGCCQKHHVVSLDMHLCLLSDWGLCHGNDLRLMHWNQLFGL